MYEPIFFIYRDPAFPRGWEAASGFIPPPGTKHDQVVPGTNSHIYVISHHSGLPIPQSDRTQYNNHTQPGFYLLGVSGGGGGWGVWGWEGLLHQVTVGYLPIVARLIVFNIQR